MLDIESTPSLQASLRSYAPKTHDQLVSFSIESCAMSAWVSRQKTTIIDEPLETLRLPPASQRKHFTHFHPCHLMCPWVLLNRPVFPGLPLGSPYKRGEGRGQGAGGAHQCHQVCGWQSCRRPVHVPAEGGCQGNRSSARTPLGSVFIPLTVACFCTSLFAWLSIDAWL